MKPILVVSFLLLGAAPLFAQGTPPPPVDEPPAEPAQDEPPMEEPPADDLPPVEPPDPEPGEKDAEEKPAKRLAPKALKVRARPKPKAAAGGRLNVDVEDMPLGDVMDAIADKAGVAIVTAAEVEEEVTVTLREIPWREAVEVIAKMCRCKVSEPWPGVLLVAPGARVTVSLEDMSLSFACELIGETAGLDVVIGPGVAGRVSLDLERVEGAKALRLAARSAGASIQIEDGLALITKAPLPASGQAPKRPEPSGPYVDLRVEEGYLDDVVLKLAKEAGLNLIPDPGQSEPLWLSLKGVPWRSALEAIAYSANARIQEEPGGILRLVRVPKVRQPLTMVEEDLREALRRLAVEAERSVVVDPSLSARVSVLVSDSPEASLFGLCRAAGLEVKEDSVGVLWIGPWRGAEAAPVASATKPAGRSLELSFTRVDLADAMEEISQQVERNILVDPNVVAHVSCQLTKADWRLAVDAIAASAGCRVEDRGNGILLLSQPTPSRVVAKAAPIRPLLRALAKLAGVNLALTPTVEGTIDLDLRHARWIEVLALAAEIAGCKLVEADYGVVIVVRDRALPKPAASPADQTYRRQIAQLVKRVEAAALAGDLRALKLASDSLRAAVQGARPKPPIGVPVPEDPSRRREVERALEKVRSDLERALRGQDVERAAMLMQDLRSVLKDELAVAVAKEVFQRPFPEYGEVGLSIKLQIQIQEGNLLLTSMARAIAAERYDEALQDFEEIKELKDEMLLEERNVFRRNAKALVLRGKALVEQAERLGKIQRRFAGLRVQATLTEGFGGNPAFKPIALINGQLVAPGERGVELPTATAIKPGRVEFLSSRGRASSARSSDTHTRRARPRGVSGATARTPGASS